MSQYFGFKQKYIEVWHDLQLLVFGLDLGSPQILYITLDLRGANFDCLLVFHRIKSEV